MVDSKKNKGPNYGLFNIIKCLFLFDHFLDARAEIMELFFWKIEDTTISFWNFLTFMWATTKFSFKSLATSSVCTFILRISTIIVDNPWWGQRICKYFVGKLQNRKKKLLQVFKVFMQIGNFKKFDLHFCIRIASYPGCISYQMDSIGLLGSKWHFCKGSIPFHHIYLYSMSDLHYIILILDLDNLSLVNRSQ